MRLLFLFGRPDNQDLVEVRARAIEDRVRCTNRHFCLRAKAPLVLSVQRTTPIFFGILFHFHRSQCPLSTTRSPSPHRHVRSERLSFLVFWRHRDFPLCVQCLMYLMLANASNKHVEAPCFFVLGCILHGILSFSHELSLFLRRPYQ